MEAKEKHAKRSLDESEGFLTSPNSTPAYKKAWASVLATTVSVLNKVLMLQKGKKLEELSILP